MKVEECTDGEVLISVVMSGLDGAGGVLLFCSGYVDGHEEAGVPGHIEAQLSVGVDTLVSALQAVAAERQEAATRRRASVPAEDFAAADELGGFAAGSGGDLDNQIVGGSAAVDSGVVNASGGGAGRAGSLPEARDADMPPALSSTPRATPAERHLSRLDYLHGRPPLPGPALPGRSPELDASARRPASSSSRACLDSSPPPFLPASSPPPTQPSSLPLGAGSGASTRPSTSPSRGSLPPVLPSNFSIPGLINPPPRILLETGRGSTRKDPPARKPCTVTIPDALVSETVKELTRNGLDLSLRARLMDFTWLYKFVLDTLVKREAPDVPLREKVNHTYPHLTPDMLRDVTVKFKMPGSPKMLSRTTPMFSNSHNMTVSSTLAIILYMKYKRDPFFLWVLGLVNAGVQAPLNAVARPSPVSKSKSRKRKQPGESDASSAASGPDAGGIAVGAEERGHTPRAVEAAGTQVQGAGEAIDGGEGAARGGDVQGGGGARAGAVRGSMGGGIGSGPVAEGGGAGVGGGEVTAAEMPRPLDSCVELAAGLLMSEGRVVARATLYPDHSTFHSGPVPASAVPCFLLSIEDGCGEVVYPYGQDPALCLEKGYPSTNPVPLSAVGTACKIAWPVASIGPRLRLFDRPPAESGAVYLGTGLLWRAAEPQVVEGAAAANQLAEILLSMPAVELFDVAAAAGKENADYPFTSAFYESSAFSSYRKKHFCDLIIPRTMRDAVGDVGTGPRRQFVLWDARFLEK